MEVLTAGDDECLCRVKLAMQPKAHRYSLAADNAVRVPGASFAAMRGVHFLGRSKAVSVGVDSRAMIWKLKEAWSKRVLVAEDGPRDEGASSKRLASDASAPPAHQVLSLIGERSEAAPTLVDDKPC